MKLKLTYFLTPACSALTDSSACCVYTHTLAPPLFGPHFAPAALRRPAVSFPCNLATLTAIRRPSVGHAPLLCKAWPR